jgi:hypothetical protein
MVFYGIELQGGYLQPCPPCAVNKDGATAVPKLERPAA